MSQYCFESNNGKIITIGKKAGRIKVLIGKNTKELSSTSALIAYTAKLFQKYGFDHEPNWDEYEKIPEAVRQKDVLKTDFSEVEDLCAKAWLQAKPKDNSGLTDLGKKVVASMRAAKAYAQR